jgi:DNA-binding NarL/FixJ family response regulator
MPEIQVIILTAYDERDLVFKAAQAGAAGVLLKDSPAADIVQAIRTVHAGHHYLPPRVGGSLFSELRANGKGSSGLSERQRQILRLVAEGCRSEQIAERLFVSDATVRRELYRAIRYLGARDRAEAVAKALRKGIL